MAQTRFEFMQTRFEFIIVLHPDKIKDFTDLLESHCKQKCYSWSWDFVYDGPTKTTLTGKLRFEVKRTLCDVKLWFVSIFGNTLCEHLSVKMVDGHTYERKSPPDFLKCKVYKKYGWKI